MELGHFIKNLQTTFEKVIESGDGSLMHKYALMYHKKGNFSKSVVLLKKAVDLGFHPAMNDLALMYIGTEEGMKTQKIDKAIALFLRASNLGNTESMMRLASLYINGEGGIEQNPDIAIDFLEKATRLGDSNAIDCLGTIYEGKYIPQVKDVQKALDLYKRFTALGDPIAMLKLADMYKGGNGVERNIEKAIGLYEKSSDKGNSTAMYNLAVLYERGNERGVGVDLEKSVHYLFNYCRLINDFHVFRVFLPKNKVNWKREYHLYWPGRSFGLNNQIKTILLISKHRNDIVRTINKNGKRELELSKETKNTQGPQFLVKGVALLIIKFLCHFIQSDEKKGSSLSAIELFLKELQC